MHGKHSDFVWIYLQSLYIDEYEYKSDNVRLPTIRVDIIILCLFNGTLSQLNDLYKCIIFRFAVHQYLTNLTFQKMYQNYLNL